MKELIIIKYGELSTKKKNIKFFIKTLKQNISKVLNDGDTVKYDLGRMYIYSNDINRVIEKLKYIFGIHEFNVGYELTTNEIDVIKTSLKSLLAEKNFKTFKVITKRYDKSYSFDSMEINRILGGFILKNFNETKVDVFDPALKVYIEIRKNYSYIYFDKIEGINGYPVGVAGKGSLMLSGGIDSPVAGYMAMKRGIKLDAIYFDSPPYTSKEALEKVKSLTKILSKYCGSINLHVIPFTEIQNEIRKNVPHEYLITIMRRMMYRISEKISKQIKAKVIVNGESIGQVASQTLSSINAIENAIDMPVIRPVACLDKLEIIDIAKKIDTYETSILPYEDCCTIFVPEHPIINPTIKKSIEYEQNIEYEKLIDYAIKNQEVLKISIFDEDEFKDLL